MRKKPARALVPVPLNGLIEVTGVKLTSIGLALPDNLDVKDGACWWKGGVGTMTVPVETPG